MDGVDNHRHLYLMGGQPPEKARFAAVRVDNIWRVRLEQMNESPPRQRVLPGMDGADKFWKQSQRFRRVGEGRCERSFRAGITARN